MRRGKNYIAEDFFSTIPTEEYIALYRDAPRVEGYCLSCRNYGKSWECPPFSYNPIERLRSHTHLLIMATKITPTGKKIPISQVQEFLRPERLRAEQLLRQWEAERGGLAFAYAGYCLYCPAGTCTRPEGLPCRHPHLARPSLEAYGFDIARTTSQLLGIELQWSTDGYLPQYLTLVGGLLFTPASLNQKR